MADNNFLTSMCSFVEDSTLILIFDECVLFAKIQPLSLALRLLMVSPYLFIDYATASAIFCKKNPLHALILAWPILVYHQQILHDICQEKDRVYTRNPQLFHTECVDAFGILLQCLV